MSNSIKKDNNKISHAKLIQTCLHSETLSNVPAPVASSNLSLTLFSTRHHHYYGVDYHTSNLVGWASGFVDGGGKFNDITKISLAFTDALFACYVWGGGSFTWFCTEGGGVGIHQSLYK